jgi:hypothetical protein
MIKLDSKPLYIHPEHAPHLWKAKRYGIYRGAKYSGSRTTLMLTIDIPWKSERTKRICPAIWADVTIHIPESSDKLDFAIPLEEAGDLMKQARRLSA